MRGVTTHPRKAVAEAVYLDHATVKNSQQGAEVKILVGAGPRGDATFEDLELLLKVLETRCGSVPVYCDQEE